MFVLFPQLHSHNLPEQVYNKKCKMTATHMYSKLYIIFSREPVYIMYNNPLQNEFT